MKKFLALSLSDVVFIMLINVKMPTIISVLTSISRIDFVISLVEHEKNFIASGQGLLIIDINTIFVEKTPQSHLSACCSKQLHLGLFCLYIISLS